MEKERRLVGPVVLIVVTIACFFLGRVTAPAPEIPRSQTFYATVDSVISNNVVVTGLEINDINHRGRFQFYADDSVEFQWRSTAITVDDLDPGDRISITYTGDVLEISPAILEEVALVQLLDDRK